MALQVTFTDAMGVLHESAYAKITKIRGNYMDKGGGMVVEVWHNFDTRSKDNEAIRKQSTMSLEYEFDTALFEEIFLISGISSIDSLYGWLKTHLDGPSNRTEDGHRLNNEGHNIDWTQATDV